MLQSFHQLKKTKVTSGGKSLGHIYGFIARDDTWNIRFYMIRKLGVVTSKLLVAPDIFGNMVRCLEVGSKNCTISIDPELLESAPTLGTSQPLSNQIDLKHSVYWWPTYPDSGGVWGAAPDVIGIFRERELNHAASDIHLRKRRTLEGLHVYSYFNQGQQNDLYLGHVIDFLIELENSMIRYFVLRHIKFFSSRHFLISPDWIDSISYAGRKAYVATDPALFATAPTFDPNVGISRQIEEELFAHYGKTGYWDLEKKFLRIMK